MARLEDIIQQMPQMPQRSSGGKTDFIVANSIIKNVLDFLTKELPGMKLNVASSDALGLSRDVMSLNKSLDALERTLEKKEDVVSSKLPDLSNSLSGLKTAIDGFDMPHIPEFPDEITAKLTVGDIKQLTPKDVKIPDSIKVNNLNAVTNCLKDIESVIANMDAVDTPSILKALKPLSLLSDKASKPISVRLSDGKRFVKAIQSLENTAKQGQQIIAMGGGGGTVRISPKGAVTSGFKALSDAGTAVQVLGTSTPIDYVEVSALGGLIAVGNSSVVATSGSEVGTILYPGNLPYKMQIDNINKLYAAGVSGTRLVYNYYV